MPYASSRAPTPPAAGTAGFPVDFTLQTRANGSTACTAVRPVTSEPNPNGRVQTYDFKTTTARYLHPQATRLDTPASDETTKYRLQLAEFTIPTGETTVTSNYTRENGDWGSPGSSTAPPPA
ncbi:glycoside hydrolase family 78 [Streptomyces sp. NPDC001530]|uniref:glycoside hydrolase family 78 n=1 Tax=Streptomyces sp. NPDC001530 TaxID=3364582 RepID=UPI003698BE82